MSSDNPLNHFKVLAKRANHLKKRISERRKNNEDVSYDVREYQSLKWAINTLSETLGFNFDFEKEVSESINIS